LVQPGNPDATWANVDDTWAVSGVVGKMTARFIARQVYRCEETEWGERSESAKGLAFLNNRFAFPVLARIMPKLSED
jgi:hypothetical protein